MSDDEVTCPLCDEYEGPPESVEAHISGKKDETHWGERGTDYRDALRRKAGRTVGKVQKATEEAKEKASGGFTRLETADDGDGEVSGGEAPSPDTDTEEEGDGDLDLDGEPDGRDYSDYAVAGIVVFLLVRWLFGESNQAQQSNPWEGW